MSVASTAFVGQVEARMAALLEIADSEDRPSQILSEASSRLSRASGAKRFRPHLVQLFGQIFELPHDALLRIAVAGELIHAASLLHDDVIDAGTERRGQPTANVQWGNSVAVLAGDWLLTRALQEVAPLGLALVQAALETVATMTRAAVREVEARGRTDLSYALWRDIAEGKSGELFAWCGSSLAALANLPAAGDTLRALGRQLGVAFQMGDDLKDLIDLHGGKDRFADLKNRNPSFALVIAMDRQPGLRERIREIWAHPGDPLPGSEVAQLGGEIVGSGALEQAQALLGDEVRNSLTLLASLASPKIVDEFISLAASFAGSQAALLRGAA